MECELLTIKDLHVTYETERATVRALNGVSLSISRGESLGLVGETGAGKTTVALSILNLLPRYVSRVTDGDIFFDGQSVFTMTRKQLTNMRGNNIAMIFQNPLTSLNPVFTVGEQIAMVLRAHTDMTKASAIKHTEELLELVGIPRSRYRDYPNQFSGGMRQRVGIAAGIACNPELLIADEPTTALDVTIQAQILELMKDLQTKFSSSLLMITHNLGIISELCDRVAVMYGGRIIEYGTVTDVFFEPAHPYTIGLMRALPSLSGTCDRLIAIPGRIADPQNLPDGCYYHPRCENRLEICKNKRPDRVKVSGDHFVECFKYQEE